MGSGWSLNDFDASELKGYGGVASVNEETSALRIYMSESNGVFFTSSIIDLTPYKTLNFIVSQVKATADSDSGTVRKLYLKVVNTYSDCYNQYSDNITQNIYLTGTAESKEEKTVYLNISNVNISGYISIGLRAQSISSIGYSYIHKIWFT